MSYATLMVHLDLKASNSCLLERCGHLAERFDASVIGIAACQPLQMVYNDGYMWANMLAQDQKEMQKEMRTLEEHFRAALHNRAQNLQWRSTTSPDDLVSDFIAREARAADLIILDPSGGNSTLDPLRRVDAGDLVIRSGRPVLLTKPGEASFDIQKVLVAWKDTREARHAVASALPVLKAATDITVVEVAEEDHLSHALERVEDVCGWLKRHGVLAEPVAAASDGDDAKRLDTIAKEKNTGLMIAGAYGHSRLREWAFGGVTRDLLMQTGRSALVSN